MDNCIFCKVINKEIPASIVYEDSNVLAIKDIKPQAPVHVVIFPKKHITGIMDFSPDDSDLAAALFNAVQQVAHITGIAGSGFRVINNWGEDGGQTISHLHLHVIGGKSLGEKIV